ncbi:citrate/2-methylcitrate synthase [Arsenicicoccus bolidensis]|uniref:Citrate synthase n=1 Tax=Arsenicicoccus bolidensis TaxID=229480 RepID=A0ABS9Q2P9_9MICO|nr:citrate/2-methylcitrate synthase [Arsenicicoccus bolidensis]MCG7322147.1 citrate synthase/methylcitrate synthase [Arsenicicoccus bolidensis]
MTDIREIAVPPGLKGLVVADTTVGDVRGAEGFYHYREHSALDLVEHCTLEEVWHLLLTGDLPAPEEASAFAEELAPLRVLDDATLDLVEREASTGITGAPLAQLRTVLSHLATGSPPTYGASPAAVRAEALRMAAATPTILAALHRRGAGLPAVAPDPTLSAAADWLWMVTGERPTPEVERAINRYLVATVDHGFNNSTFAARVVASSGADVGSALCAALGAFSGPLHGGAPDRALEALDQIGTVDRAPAWVRERVAAGDRIMGFGHAVYTTHDPRAEMLKAEAQRLGGPLVDLAVAVEQVVEDTLAELKPGRRLYANVEYYAGVVMERCGIPRSMFTPTFAVSRVVGWSAHVLEQATTTKIYRPSARYVGPPVVR